MDAHSTLSQWESFYVIIGSSAAALTGLQFVVIALVTETQARSGIHEVAAFGTPTVLHFCAVLFVSAVLSAPWHELGGVAIAIGAGGVLGAVYALLTARRARRTTQYRPVLEDWIWHAMLPLVAYLVLAIAAAALPRAAAPALFAIAGSALLLLFVGIHNAWDSVTYIALLRPSEAPEAESAPPPPAETKSGTAGPTM